MRADWSLLLASPGYLGELYGGTPPSPESCDPFYVHIDERGNSVTLGLHTKVFPVSAPTEWREKGFNAFEFYLVFEGVEGLRVSAWGPSQAGDIDLTIRDERFDVVLGSAASGIAFRAGTARLARTHAYLASGSPPR
ncbi:Imm50 family immunity protein [Streptomyces sp. NPDC002144]